MTVGRLEEKMIKLMLLERLTRTASITWPTWLNFTSEGSLPVSSCLTSPQLTTVWTFLGVTFRSLD